MMQGRKIITIAATASLTLLAGAGGIALSSGILGASADDGVGQVSPVGTSQIAPADQADEAPVSVVPPTVAVPDVPGAAGNYDDDDDDRYEDEEHEDEEHEYEGAEDDD